jgi:hypothetical protein
MQPFLFLCMVIRTHCWHMQLTSLMNRLEYLRRCWIYLRIKCAFLYFLMNILLRLLWLGIGLRLLSEFFKAISFLCNNFRCLVNLWDILIFISYFPALLFLLIESWINIIHITVAVQDCGTCLINLRFKCVLFHFRVLLLYLLSVFYFLLLESFLSF